MANKDKLIENAQKFLEKGQLPKAIGEYQKIVDAFPKDFRNRQKLAELLSREKRYDEAQPHYEAVAKNFTDTGFYLKAIALYKQMQKLEPTRADIYLRLAELNEKQGLIGNSLNEYRCLVTLYEKNHKLHEALEIMRKMLALEPDNCAVRSKLVETLVAVDEQAEALEQFYALDRMLQERGDQAGLAKLHENFAAFYSQMAESRSQSALPAAAAGAAPEEDAAAAGLIAPAVSRAAPIEPAGRPELELELELEVPPAQDDLPQEPAAPSQAPSATVSPAALPLEISLELDLDMPASNKAGAEPPASAADVPVDESAAATLPLESLVLPEFCDLDLELAQPAQAATEPTDGTPPSQGDTAGAGEGGASEAAEGRETFDGLEAIDESLAADEFDAIEELEELEEIDDAEAETAGTGCAAFDDGCHDAGVYLDNTGAAGFDETLGGSSREDDEDAQSHFDLGIAYKEMGLLNEAIAEFSKAAHEPSRRLDCLTLQGQCRHAMGEYNAAEVTFKEALGSQGLTDEVRVALRYELGLLYEAAGRTLEALESYQFVADRDLFFRDVVTKLKSLRESLGLDDQPADAKGARPSRDRISYV